MTMAPTTPVDSQPRPLAQRAGTGRAVVWAHAVVMALCAIAGMAVVVRYAIHSVTGFEQDQRMMLSLGTTTDGWARLTEVLGSVTDVSVAVCLGVCVVIAMIQRRWAVAVAAVVVIAGANITTQVLKYEVLQSVSGRNTLPSGHTTVGLSLALAAVVVASHRWRPLVTAGAAAVATFIGAGTVAAHWHRPGDVLAAGMVCLGWVAVALAIAGSLQRRAPSGRRSGRLAVASFVGVAFAGLAVVANGVRPTFGIHDLSVAMVALCLLGAMFAVVVGWVSVAVDRVLA